MSQLESVENVSVENKSEASMSLSQQAWSSIQSGSENELAGSADKSSTAPQTTFDRTSHPTDEHLPSLSISDVNEDGNAVLQKQRYGIADEEGGLSAEPTRVGEPKQPQKPLEGEPKDPSKPTPKGPYLLIPSMQDSPRKPIEKPIEKPIKPGQPKPEYELEGEPKDPYTKPKNPSQRIPFDPRLKGL